MAHLAEFHRAYWSEFQNLAQNETPELQRTSPSNSYLIFPIGIGGAHLAASILVSRNLVTFYLLIQGKHRNELFAHLNVQKAEVEMDLREAAVWTVSCTSNRARVTVELAVDDFDDRQDWARQHRWITERAKNFDRAFYSRLHDLRGNS